MQQYSVFINYGEGSQKFVETADSPKEAALKGCYRLSLLLNKGITKEKIEKSLKQKKWTGNWGDWWGAYVEVSSDNKSKIYTYDCTAI